MASIFATEAAALQRATPSRIASPEVRRLAALFDELPLPLYRWELECMGLAGRPRVPDDGDSPDGNPSVGYELLSPIQFEVLRHAEQIYTPDTYYLLRYQGRRDNHMWVPRRFVNFVFMMVGKGGGKDRVAVLTALRIAYLCLCLRSPQGYFGIGQTSKIDMLNTASSEGQAETIYYEEFKGLLDNAPWFRGRYTRSARETWFDRSGKRIHAISGNSKEEAQEGMNLLYGCLDEIDAFKTKEEREATARTQRGAMLNAEGIFEMMHTSGSSRFPRAFKVMALSWPRYVGSFIWSAHTAGLKALEERGDESRVYVIPSQHGAATWESNPIRKREDFDQDYAENPELARAKYECKPPESEAPYIKNRLALEVNFTSPYPVRSLPDGRLVDELPLDIEYYWGLSDALDMVAGPVSPLVLANVAPAEGWQVRFNFADYFYPEDEWLRAIHVDLGIRKDRCGFAMSHVRGWTEMEVPRIDLKTGARTMHLLRRPLVTVDLVTHFEPPSTPEHPKGEVEIRWVRQLIFELIARGFHIGRVTFDGYQSTDSIQILNAYGVEADLLSMDRNLGPYDTAKSVLYSGGMIANPNDILKRELRALTLINGKKVDHPPGGSKDLADAWGGSVFGAIEISEYVGGVEEIPGVQEARQALYHGERSSASVIDAALEGLPPDLFGLAGLPLR